MCGYFYIGFLDLMSKGKILKDFTNLFGKIDKGILHYFLEQHTNINKPHVCEIKQVYL